MQSIGSQEKKTDFRKFFGQFAHFFTGNALSVIIGLISFPILTRALSKEQYGVLSLINTTLFISVTFAKAGMPDGIIRFFKDYNSSNESLHVFCSTVVIRGLIFSSLMVAAYILFLPYIVHYLNIQSKYLVCFSIMAIYLFFRPLNIIVLNFLRVTDKTAFYASINIFNRITSVFGSLMLLLWFIKEFYGYFVGVIISELLVSLILFGWFFSHYKVHLSQVSNSLSVQLMKFGLPLLFTELLYLLLAYVDRYLIVAYMGEGALGLYSVGYNLAAYVSDMIMFAVAYTVVPIYVGIYKNDGREHTELFLQKCLKYLLTLMIPIFFGYIALSRDIFLVLASEKYVSAASFSPIILLGSYFIGLNSIFNAGLYLQKKTKTIMIVMLSALLINIVLNILLLPRYGVYGAALATLGASMLSSALTIALSSRYITVRIDMRTVFFYVLLSGVMFLAMLLIKTNLAWLTLLTKMAIGVTIISSGIFFRERELILSFIRTRRFT